MSILKWEIIIEVEMPEIVLKAGTRMNKLACPWEAFLIGIHSLRFYPFAKWVFPQTFF